MIFYQHSSKPSQNEINHRKMKQTSKNYFLEKQASDVKRKQKQSSGCFCFSFGKKNDVWPNRNELSRVEPDEGTKDEALRMSREIAAKSFKNISILKSNPRIQRESGKREIKNPSYKDFCIDKLHSQQSQKSSQMTRHQKSRKKQQFNMNRLTFSAVNISYQKTVNTATTITMNQSSSIEGGSILDVKKINLLKSAHQFEVIKQQTEEIQLRKSKIMTIKQKQSQSPQAIDSTRYPHELTIRKVETSQEILSKPSSNEDIDNIVYDYSSIIIDYFNPSAEMMEKIEQKKDHDNENQQSKVFKNQSEISRYQPKHTQYYNQSNDQN